MLYNFDTKEDLIFQIEQDGMCLDVWEWLQDHESLGSILEEMPKDWRVKALARGYAQFLEHLDVNLLSAWGLAYILLDCPELSESILEKFKPEKKENRENRKVIQELKNRQRTRSLEIIAGLPGKEEKENES